MSTLKLSRFSRKKEVLQRRSGAAPWLVLGGMLFAVALWHFPIYIAVINAFKPEKEYVQGGVLTFPKHLDFTKIVKFWNDVDFSQKLYNSIKISLSVSK